MQPEEISQLARELWLELHPQCDGSCLTYWHGPDQLIPCEDGEDLRFYFCTHLNEWVLTNYIPQDIEF